MKKPLITLIILLLLAAAGYYGWQHLQTDKDGSAPMAQGGGTPVQVYEIKPQTWASSLTSVGTIMANEMATLQAEVPGRVVAIHFTEGQAVKQDDVLIEIDPSQYQAEVNRAQATYTLAKDSYERRKKLQDSGAVSRQDNDTFLAAMREARADLEFANIRLTLTKIKAPFDGITGLRNISPGDYLQVGQELVHVVAIDPVKLDFALPQKQAGRIQPGQPLRIQVDAQASQTFGGEVYAIDPVLDEVTRNIRLRAVLPNGEGLLRPGMFANITLPLPPIDQGVVVPEQTLTQSTDTSTAYKVVEGKASLVTVTVLDRKDGMALVKGGNLQVGDQLIQEGLLKVKPGAPVSIIPAKTPAKTPAKPKSEEGK